MKKQEMTQQEIVEKEIRDRGEGNDWKTAYVMISRLIRKPEWRLFRAGDTLFLMHNLRDPNKTVEFYIYNGDTEKELKENLKDFFKALKISGFKQAVFTPISKYNVETIKKAHKDAKEDDGVVLVKL